MKSSLRLHSSCSLIIRMLSFQENDLSHILTFFFFSRPHTYSNDCLTVMSKSANTSIVDLWFQRYNYHTGVKGVYIFCKHVQTIDSRYCICTAWLSAYLSVSLSIFSVPLPVSALSGGRRAGQARREQTRSLCVPPESHLLPPWRTNAVRLHTHSSLQHWQGVIHLQSFLMEQTSTNVKCISNQYQWYWKKKKKERKIG